jgi:hypothetical protein
MFNGKIRPADTPAVRSRPCRLCQSLGATVLINGKQRTTPATRILVGGEGRCEQHYHEFGTKQPAEVQEAPHEPETKGGDVGIGKLR